MIKTVIGIVVACASALSLAQSAPSPAAKDEAPPPTPAAAASRRGLPFDGEPTLARIESSGVLRVGVAVNPPWVMHDAKGELSGYSVDIAHRIADSMGWKLELVPTSWPRLMLDLRTDKFDVIISGLSITPQRARYVNFSASLGEFDIAAVVNRHKFGQTTLAELAKVAHPKIAAHRGELTVDIAHAALPNAEIVAVDDDDAAIADLRAGKLDGYVAEAPVPQLLEKIYPEQLRGLSSEPLARTAHGLAVRKNDVGLLRVLNAWIVYEQASGWLKARSAYWFEDTAWASAL
jgi:polar amino acid transport system substrate-binding protein